MTTFAVEQPATQTARVTRCRPCGGDDLRGLRSPGPEVTSARGSPMPERASDDGYLLRQFPRHGVPTLGVEPTRR